MTLEQRAEKIARECIASHAIPFYVSATQHQSEQVIRACAAQVLIHLKDLLADYHIKFTP